MLSKNNIDDLKNILKNDNVLSEKEERYCYAEDAANLNHIEALPDAVVFVETVDDVQKVLKYANQHLIPVVARGAGTNMVGACVCNKGGIVLNFSRMNKILDFNPSDMTMKVQPGVVLNDIKKLAESKGLMYPPDPSNYRVSTIGGSIAQSSGGAKSFKYGTTKDYILSMKVVLSDGTLVQLGTPTVKDAVGYHLNQLIVGSEGTLAIVVEADLKLIPKPNESRLIVSYYKTYSDAINSVNNILSSGIFPSTIDFMDQNSITTVENYASCGFKSEYECLVLIELDGVDSESMNAQENKTISLLKSSGAVDVMSAKESEQIEKIWTARQSSYAAAAKLGPDVVSDDIIVPRSKLAEMLEFSKSISEKYDLNMCIVGHIGDGNIHPQFVLDLYKDEDFKNYINAKSEMYKMAVSLGGTISSEHGVGLEKMSYAEEILDKSALEYMRSIKKLFDPNNILNPGKIFNL